MNFSSIDQRLTYYNAKVQLWEHLKKRIQDAQSARKAQRDALRDAQNVSAYVQELRRYFLDHLGGLPRVEGVPAVKLCGEIEEVGLTIQNLMLETRPGVKATANLYLPDGTVPNTPAILFLCGHTTLGKAEPRYQTVCRILASRGFIVLALDPTGQGERLNYYDPATGNPVIISSTGDHEYGGFQCLLQGHNLSRYMLHDAMRAIDFLSAHPLVDASRIGLTGNSGGGTQTCLMMLLEPRLAAAAPSSFVSSRLVIFESGYAQDAEQIWRGFSEAGYDHADLLLSFAPKPLCVLSPEYDFFPIEGKRITLDEVWRFWEMSGDASALQAVEDRGARHGYTNHLGEAAADFFAKHLAHHTVASAVDRTPLAENKLWSTKSGLVLKDDPKSKTIFEENSEAFATTRKDLKKGRTFLHDAVFKARRPVDLNLRITQEFVLGEIVAFSGFWWSQAGILNSGILFCPPAVVAKPWPVTVALWEDGTKSLLRHEAWIRQEVASGRAVFVFNVTGMGPLEPHPFNCTEDLKAHYATMFRVCDDLVTLGDSLAALRTYDVLRSLDTLGKWGGLNGEDVRCYLHGPYGIYGALASALEERLKHLTWIDPMMPWCQLLETKYYNDRDIKSLIIPGLVRLSDWTELASPLQPLPSARGTMRT